MSEKPQVDPNQIWMIVLIAVPASMLMNLGQSFAPEGGMTQSLYSGLFAGLGGLLGFAAYTFTKNGTTISKVIGVIFLLAISSAILIITHA